MGLFGEKGNPEGGEIVVVEVQDVR
jgi:hypothetical protein